MSHAAEPRPIIGVNWGSSNFRAYRIGPDGSALDEFSTPSGVASLDRAGMSELMNGLVDRWGTASEIYASGMIGSNIGWTEVPYAAAPAGLDAMARGMTTTSIGKAPVSIVPGITCTRRFDGAPDILRGEEIELMGLAALIRANGPVALPGTHTKWVMLEGGCVRDFFTSMSGEIFDRLTAQGLLASIVEDEATDGEAFRRGVETARERKLGLGTLLFGARARVICGELPRSDAASYIRGLLIGSEIADALSVYPELREATVPLVGNGPLCELYASALAHSGVASTIVDSRLACLLGFRALHEARVA